MESVFGYNVMVYYKFSKDSALSILVQTWSLLLWLNYSPAIAFLPDSIYLFFIDLLSCKMYIAVVQFVFIHFSFRLLRQNPLFRNFLAESLQGVCGLLDIVQRVSDSNEC